MRTKAAVRRRGHKDKFVLAAIAQSKASEPGIHNHHRECRFRSRASGRQLPTEVLSCPGQLSGRFEPLDFRLEFKAQLRAFLVGQPVRHLRKDGPVKQNRLRLPWQLLRGAGFGENLVEFGAHLIRIGPVLGRGCILAQQVGLLVLLEKVALSGRGHAAFNPLRPSLRQVSVPARSQREQDSAQAAPTCQPAKSISTPSPPSGPNGPLTNF